MKGRENIRKKISKVMARRNYPTSGWKTYNEKSGHVFPTIGSKAG